MRDKVNCPAGCRPHIRHKPLVQPVGQAEPAERVIQRDLDGKPRAAGLAEGEHVFGSTCEMGACIRAQHGGAGQRRGGCCLRAAFSFVGGGIVIRCGQPQDKPGTRVAVGFYQKALSGGDPGYERLGQRFQPGFKGGKLASFAFVNTGAGGVELVAVFADLQ